MKTILAVIALTLALCRPVAAQKPSEQYQVGTFLGTEVLADGTYTNNIQCGSGPGYTCAGSAGFNSFHAYYVKTAEGVWAFVTKRENEDVGMRKLGMTPVHLLAEKPNLLDSLKPNDRVTFRVQHIGRQNFFVWIPRADNPKKDDKFYGTLTPNTVQAETPKATDNIKAMCDSHRFSPDDEKKYCPAPVADQGTK